jgi:hypothetical protein
MKRRFLKWALPVASLALGACGSSSGAGSCTYTAGGVSECVDYIGSAYTGSGNAAKSACSANPGSTYSSGSCAAGSNGTCDIEKGTGDEYKITYGGLGDGGTAELQQECTALGGTFSS